MEIRHRAGAGQGKEGLGKRGDGGGKRWGGRGLAANKPLFPPKRFPPLTLAGGLWGDGFTLGFHFFVWEALAREWRGSLFRPATSVYLVWG